MDVEREEASFRERKGLREIKGEREEKIGLAVLGCSRQSVVVGNCRGAEAWEEHTREGERM